MRRNRNETPEPTIDLTKFEILALDIATHWGYFSAQESGKWNFTESKHRNDNKQHKAFRDTLMGFMSSHGIKQVYAEDINVNNHFCDMRKLSEFRGILFEVCDELNLPEPQFINVATLKKYATGNGKADKSQMIEACLTRYGHTPIDDNEADACHIYFYFLKRYHIPWVTDEDSKNK